MGAHNGSVLDRIVLVTGSGGFIGRHLVARLRSLNRPVIEIRGRIDCDLRDPSAVRRRLEGLAPEVVFHLAASRDGSADQDSAYLNTVQCMSGLLEALPEGRHCTVVNVGSYKQYGTIPAPFSEEAIPSPQSSYACGKQDAEHLLASRLSPSLSGVLARLGPVIGPGQPNEALIPHTLHLLRETSQPQIFAADSWWDPIYIDDALDALLRLAHCQEARGQIINLSSGCAWTPRRVVVALAALYGLQRDATTIRPRCGQPLLGDVGRSRKLLGWRPKIGLEEGLRRIAANYRLVRAEILGYADQAPRAHDGR